VIEYGLLLATVVLLVLVATNLFGGLLRAWLAALALRLTATGR
jgi:Flp pilus assembly pilin Flp